MMGEINKTDKLDARGLNRLQRSGTLPTVWIPPASYGISVTCRAVAVVAGLEVALDQAHKDPQHFPSLLRPHGGRVVNISPVPAVGAPPAAFGSLT
jgi:hypothetical protein